MRDHQASTNMMDSALILRIISILHFVWIIRGEIDTDIFEVSHYSEHPEFVDRIEKHNSCTEEQRNHIEEQCTDVVMKLVHIVLEYEHAPRQPIEDYVPLTRCERAQIACYSHKVWRDASQCVCTVCDHLWLYDEHTHYRFSDYWKDHSCPGEFPIQMDENPFCQFMNTTKDTIPDSCKPKEAPKQQQREETNQAQATIHEPDEWEPSASVFYKYQVSILWTMLLGGSMIVSVFYYIQ